MISLLFTSAIMCPVFSLTSCEIPRLFPWSFQFPDYGNPGFAFSPRIFPEKPLDCYEACTIKTLMVKFAINNWIRPTFLADLPTHLAPIFLHLSFGFCWPLCAFYKLYLLTYFCTENDTETYGGTSFNEVPRVSVKRHSHIVFCRHPGQYIHLNE